MPRRRVPYDGREIDAEDVPFRIEQDGDVRLRVEDGALLRLRPVVLSVLRTEERNADGERVYIVQTLVHISLDEAESREREAKE